MSDPNLTGQPNPGYFPQQPAPNQQTYDPPKEPYLTEKLDSGYVEQQAPIQQGNAQTWGPDPYTKPPPKMPKTLKEWMIGGSIAGTVMLIVLMISTIATSTLLATRSIVIGWFLIMVPSTFRLKISLLLSHLKVGLVGGILVGLVTGPFMALIFALGAGFHFTGFQQRFPTIDKWITPPMILRRAFWGVQYFATSAGAVYLGIEVLRWWHGGVLPEGSAALRVDPFWGAVCGGVGHLVWIAYQKFKGTTQPAAPPAVTPNQPPQGGAPVNIPY